MDGVCRSARLSLGHPRSGSLPSVFTMSLTAPALGGPDQPRPAHHWDTSGPRHSTTLRPAPALVTSAINGRTPTGGLMHAPSGQGDRVSSVRHGRQCRPAATGATGKADTVVKGRIGWTTEHGVDPGRLLTSARLIGELGSPAGPEHRG